MNRAALFVGVLCISLAVAIAAYLYTFSWQAVTECDQLAAHPDDLQRSTAIKGVSDGDIDVKKALEACLQHAENSPESLTIRFQLGRVLYLAGHEQEAKDVLQSAADEGYFAASAYLGEMTDGLVEALSHHAEAASGGFLPSKAKAQELDNEIAALQKISPVAAAERCDYQASHPDDSERPSSAFGVLDANMDVEAAIDACTDAVRLNPDDRRMKFQLARGLIIAGLEDEGKRYLIEANDAGHQFSATYLESNSLSDLDSEISLSCEGYAEFYHNNGEFLGDTELNFSLYFKPRDNFVTIEYNIIPQFREKKLLEVNVKYNIIKFDEDILSFRTNNFGAMPTNDGITIDLNEWSLYHYQRWSMGTNFFGIEIYWNARAYGFCAPKGA